MILTMILARIPSSSTSKDTTALSVSTSHRMSPAAKESPGIIELDVSYLQAYVIWQLGLDGNMSYILDNWN